MSLYTAHATLEKPEELCTVSRSRGSTQDIIIIEYDTENVSAEEVESLGRQLRNIFKDHHVFFLPKNFNVFTCPIEEVQHLRDYIDVILKERSKDAEVETHD